MKVTKKCTECDGTGEIVTKGKPFLVGDRVTSAVGRKDVGKVVCPQISSEALLRIRGGGNFIGPIYVVQFDDGHIQYVSEMGLNFEED